MASLAALEMRVDMVQNHVDHLVSGAHTSDLKRRAAQCTAALDRCRRCDFGAEMRAVLELKIRMLEHDVARGMDDTSSELFSFFH